MKTLRSLLPIALLALLAPQAAHTDDAAPEKLYYGIEMGGVLCGYSELTVSPLSSEGQDLILVDQHMFLMVSALGSRFNSDIRLIYHLDPETGRFVFHDSVVEQGGTKLSSRIRIDGNVARCTSSLDDGEKTVELGENVVLENTLVFPHLLRDFVKAGLEKREYEVFEVREQEVQTSTYTRLRSEAVELAGRTIDTVVIEKRNHATGLKLTLWLDRETGRVVQSHIPPARRGYLADASVVKRIEVANLDASITAPTNVSIADVRGITYMQVRAALEPTGLAVTPESLNVPGQAFAGTVEENRIEGVFEIEHPRYEGADAPPFPPALGSDESLAPYLEAEEFIDADDPVLVEKARELTKGATDCWDASRRLATWVSEHIDYAIPGGMTARRTYDTRTGECGSHSFLFAAFCRAVGIPARVVWGCMYIPSQGGAFGQHAWNEVYMGEAGWIPIDTTATETDFVDSGHIRLGELSSVSIAVNLKEMEVLDHRVGSGAGASASSDSSYEPYLGEYTHPAGGARAKARVQDGALVVEIPGSTVLALHDPDESGAWYAKLTDRVYCTFEKDGEGHVVELHIHQLVRMQKTGSPDEIDPCVPETERRYLGTYLLAPRQATFEVVYQDGGLAVKDPLAKKTVGLGPPDAKGRRLDEFGKNTLYFEEDPDGTIRALVIDAVSRFRR